VVCSTLTKAGSDKAMEALSLHAMEVMQKNMEMGPVMVNELVRKVKAAAASRVDRRPPARPRGAGDQLPARLSKPAGQAVRGLIAIGSSTGGPEALSRVLAPLPQSTPPILIVQHMPPLFTASLAERLDRLCAIEVREASDRDTLHPGLALVAPGDRHLLVTGRPGRYRTELRDGPRVGLHKPAVEVLFRSVARAAAEDAVGVMLTGMGADGSKGMKAMHDAGAWNIAQDEATCVVYGMPREAVQQGGVDEEVGLDDIAGRILTALTREAVVTS
jgi:two-component system chemotaxis response regulator CheB